jgi:hypothetical protein
MKMPDHVEEFPTETERQVDPDPLSPLVVGRATTSHGLSTMSGGVVVGELVGMTDDGRTPLVTYPGQSGSAAIAARSILDLHGTHVGRQVVLVFEEADLSKPIVMGVLHTAECCAFAVNAGEVQVEADGRRVIVTARDQLVLRCGKASVTLTKEGKILIQGTYVSTHSSGVNRIKGGSVQVN